MTTLCAALLASTAPWTDARVPLASPADPARYGSPLSAALPETIVLHPFGYTYLEANYAWTDSDDLDQELSGYEVRASWEILFNLFVEGSYGQQSDDTDVDEFRLGVGYHLPLGDRIDVYGVASWAQAKVDGGGLDDTVDGTQIELGARYWLSERIELDGAGVWLDLEDSDVGVEVGARLYATRFLSVGAELSFLDGDTGVAAGVRLEL